MTVKPASKPLPRLLGPSGCLLQGLVTQPLARQDFIKLLRQQYRAVKIIQAFLRRFRRDCVATPPPRKRRKINYHETKHVSHLQTIVSAMHSYDKHERDLVFYILKDEIVQANDHDAWTILNLVWSCCIATNYQNINVARAAWNVQCCLPQKLNLALVPKVIAWCRGNLKHVDAILNVIPFFQSLQPNKHFETWLWQYKMRLSPLVCIHARYCTEPCYTLAQVEAKKFVTDLFACLQPDKMVKKNQSPPSLHPTDLPHDSSDDCHDDDIDDDDDDDNNMDEDGQDDRNETELDRDGDHIVMPNANSQNETNAETKQADPTLQQVTQEDDDDDADYNDDESLFDKEQESDDESAVLLHRLGNKNRTDYVNASRLLVQNEIEKGNDNIDTTNRVDCDDDDLEDDEDDDCNGDHSNHGDDDIMEDIEIDSLCVMAAAEVTAARDNEEKPDDPATTFDLIPSLDERRKVYLNAAMHVLSWQYPLQLPRPQSQLLPIAAQTFLLETVHKFVKAPKQPHQAKIILRRAPTQEEFFRGSLSRNPVSLEWLATNVDKRQGGDVLDPTVKDLRQFIAKDLQMADSADLIEIIVANRILDLNLKLRVVHQTLWRQYLSEDRHNEPRTGSLFAASAGASLMFFSSLSTRNMSSFCATSDVSPMVATYRLAGVDGEATEDVLDSNDLIDPDAPAANLTPRALEQLMEQEYNLTRNVMEGRGVYVLLRSVQHELGDMLRQIRRDDVGTNFNDLRAKFQNDAPSAGLTLLSHCTKLANNRRLLLRARTPTVLLNLLLDVLKLLEGPMEGDTTSSTSSNPTAEKLQELIETLTSDISLVATDRVLDEEGSHEINSHDASSMPLLLESIMSLSLSSPLRTVIAKLLPFLTYGQASLCRELAEQFDRHIEMEKLFQCETTNPHATQNYILMNTFVQTAISLSTSDVCHSLRKQLVACGFVERLSCFVILDMPKQPPSWSTALWSRGDNTPSKKHKTPKPPKVLDDAWRNYFGRGGVKTALRILSGLCKKHDVTQSVIAHSPYFMRSCHWIEATSDSLATNVQTNGLGLVAETLLDDLMDGNVSVAKYVEDIRAKTRLRKKDIAHDRRSRALLKMNSFGASSDAVPSTATLSSSNLRDTAASILAPVFGLFRDAAASQINTSNAPAETLLHKPHKVTVLPAWMKEMESMEDEAGLTCAVCQEGRTLQPKELLGLYAYVKKVTVHSDQGGNRLSIDGTALLKALPDTVPDALDGSHAAEIWFSIGKAAGEDLASAPSNSSISRRTVTYTTTVSAGNAIHFSCHQKARRADRNHPKAPKSEWEGANLRNNRVNCNVILPLVSSRSSSVPLFAVDSALREHQSAVANLLGSTTISMLWTVLHDVRFLLLRMAYGESLSHDCGGGSLASNCQLVFYQLLTADMFDKDAQIDQPLQSQHARALSPGFLAACCILTDNSGDYTALKRCVTDAAPMACLTAILFSNTLADDRASEGDGEQVHPKRQWIVGKEEFLRGLLMWGGRRHALGVNGSGCSSSREVTRRQRSSSFVDWELVEGDDEGSLDSDDHDTVEDRGPDLPASSQDDVFRRPNPALRARSGRTRPTIEDFKHALRPVITLFAIFAQLSADFCLQLDDTAIQSKADNLMTMIRKCQGAPSLKELLECANVDMDHEEMMVYLQKGMIAA